MSAEFWAIIGANVALTSLVVGFIWRLDMRIGRLAIRVGRVEDRVSSVEQRLSRIEGWIQGRFREGAEA